MKALASAVLVVGLASVSAWTSVQTDGEAGTGWAVFAVLAWILSS